MVETKLPGPLIGGRYRLQEQLGKGGMGRVYRATDRLTRQDIALKQILTEDEVPGSTPESTQYDPRFSLAQEFQSLATLHHPHIIGVLDYGFDAERRPYFTMDLLEGAATILEAGENQPLLIQVGLLVQTLQALAYIHRRGIVHRDLKPGNILVVPSRPNSNGPYAAGQVRMLDFGLSVEQEQARGTVGTLAYMAPEVLVGEQYGPDADLYAVGVLAYQLISGQHPFMDGSSGNIISNILNKPPDLSHPAIPETIRPILHCLLAKQPDERYGDAAKVIEALGAAVGQPFATETEATRESFLQAATLIGREGELTQLTTAFRQMMVGRGSTWLVSGESGVGKSRLLEELRTVALVGGAMVLRGQAVSGGGSPYTIWQPVVRRLVLQTQLDDLEVGVLQTLVPDIGDLLEREIIPVPVLNTQATHSRMLSTISALFQRQSQPMVVLLEDLQWAGDESLELLTWLNRQVRRQAMLIVGNYRDDERPELPQRLPEMSHLKLERLNNEEIAELSATMLGEAGRQARVVNLLQRETEGNPFFLVEVVRALAEEAGQLEKVGTTTLPAHVFTGGLQRLVERRLNQVPAEAHVLLHLAAVAGRELDLVVLQAAQPEADLERWLTVCANAAVIAIQDERWLFSHDKLRESLLHQLDGEAQKQLHGRVALAIETAHPDAPEQAARLAFHWARAEDWTKERHYAAQAGQYALRSAAHQEAIIFLNRALHLEEMYSLPDTAQEGSAVQEGTAVQLRRARWLRQIGEAYLALAQFVESQAALQRMLALLGWPVPNSRMKLAGTILGQIGRQLVHRVRPKWVAEAAQRERKAALLEATQAYQQLAEIYYFANDKPMILLCGLRAVNLSERAGPSPALARAYGNLVLVAGLLRRHKLAEIYSKLALETAEAANDIPALAWVLLLDGTYRVGLGQWRVTQERADKALALARQVGDKRVVGLVLALRSLLPFHLGHFEEARAWCAQWYEAGSEIDNTQHQTAGLMGQAENLLRLEQPQAALELLERAFDIWAEKANREELDRLGRFRGYVTMAMTRLRLEEWAAARQAADEAMELLPYVSSPNRVTMLEAIGSLAHVYLLLWDKGKPDQALITAANTACELLEKYARVFPIMSPRANVLLGLRESLLLRSANAHDYWQKGLAAAEQFGMPYEQALAHSFLKKPGS